VLNGLQCRVMQMMYGKEKESGESLDLFSSLLCMAAVMVVDFKG